MKLTVERCCCMSLRTGGLVIGWLSIAMHSAAILNQIYNLFSPQASGNNNGPQTSPTSGLGIIIVDLVFSAMLIYGIQKNKHKWLLPSLVLRGFGIVVGVPLAILAFIIFCSVSEGINIGLVIFVVFLVALIIALNVWIWMVIYSLYLEIRMFGLMQLRGPSQQI